MSNSKGYYADDGYAPVHYAGAKTGRQAAQQYVDDGSWGPVMETMWIHVHTWREVDGEHVDEEEHTITLHPPVPPCAPGEDHDWQAPHSVVGGCVENPGVRGHGGGTISTEVCRHCRRYRVTDTWAQDRNGGEQGLTSLAYRDADEVSMAWKGSS